MGSSATPFNLTREQCCDLSMPHSMNYHCKIMHSFNYQICTELLLCAGE